MNPSSRHTGHEAGPSMGWVRPAFTVLTLAPVAYVLLGPSLAIPYNVRAMGVALWLLTLLPSWVQLFQRPERRTPVPFVQIIGLLFGMYYALPMMLGSYNLGTRIVLDPYRDFNDPVFLTLAGWLFLLVGYYGIGMVFAGKKVEAGVEHTIDHLRGWGFALLFGGLAVDLATKFLRIPQALRSLLQLSHSLMLFGVGLLVVLAVRGKLGPHGRYLMYAGILAVAAMQVGTGLISNLAFLVAMIFLAVWIAQGYMGPRWLVVGAAGMVMIVALKTVTMEYRRLAWYGGQTVSGVDGARLMVDLLVNRVETEGLSETVDRGVEMIAARSSIMDMMADVVDRTPQQVPFLNGQTYLPLIGMAVPRVLWPDKPVKNMGQMFGHRYGYLDSWDTATSVNCPFLIEFYMNFGQWGVLFGMLLVGIIYRLMRNLINNPGQSPLVSLLALALMVPMLNIESDFSLTFGGLLMNGVALWLVLRAIQLFSRPAAPRLVASPEGAMIGSGATW